MNPGEVRDEALLPSFLYLPGATRFPGGLARAALGRGPPLRRRTAGAEARRRRMPAAWSRRPSRGCRTPASIAPRRILPLERARRRARRSRRWRPRAATCEHLRDAWNAKMPDAPFDEQQVLVTVPASFDAVARELTLEGRRAGRLSERHAARGAAGRLLRLDRAASRLARARQRGRPDSGGRYRRRHHRLHADRRHRTATANWRSSASRSASTSCSAATTSISRWPARSTQQLAAKGTKHRQPAAPGAVAATAASPRRSCSTRNRRRRKQPVTILGKGTGLVGGTIKAKLHARRHRAGPARRLLPDGRQQRHAAAAAARRACRRSACPTRPMRRSPGTWRGSCGSRRRRRARRGAPRPERPRLPDARPVQRRRAAAPAWCASASSTC